MVLRYLENFPALRSHGASPLTAPITGLPKQVFPEPTDFSREYLSQGINFLAVSPPLKRYPVSVAGYKAGDDEDTPDR
ncbi:MAG: hypothetical protein KME57_28175 [Scytonema hyalinum WJT4-NPBG1]|nr:hypothetical protein [Scytonema hyalinum WJT4-NPBG1]